MTLTKKEQFVELLKTAGLDADFSGGVPVVYVASAEEMKGAEKTLNELAEKSGYNESRGVKVRKERIKRDDLPLPLLYTKNAKEEMINE